MTSAEQRVASAGRRAAGGTSQAVQALLAEAAEAAAAAGAGELGVGDLVSYLTSYYRLVAAEDLVPGIPRTLSGKKLEIPVRKILLGTPVEQAADPSALANPEVLSHFAPRPAEGLL